MGKRQSRTDPQLPVESFEQPVVPEPALGPIEPEPSTPAEPEAPVVPESPQQDEAPALDVPGFRPAQIGALDRKRLFKLFYALVNNQVGSRVGPPAVREIGKIFGAETYEQELEVWGMIKREVLEAQR